MIQYVLGFLFSPHQDRVVLIEKLKPEWMKGKLNGVGGKIEMGELPITAMRREFKEETGVAIHDWDQFAVLTGDHSLIYCFRATVPSSIVDQVSSVEQEKVVIYNLGGGGLSELVWVGLPNLQWILPMAIFGERFQNKAGAVSFEVEEVYSLPRAA